MAISQWFAFVVITLLTCGGDYFLKEASLHTRPYTNLPMQVAVVLYAISAYIWCYLLQKVTLGTMGIMYAAMTAVVAVALGSLVYGEPMTPQKFLGGVLAVVAVALVSE